MKKFILAFSLLAITTFASAQIRQGQFLVGGNANFSSAKVSDMDGSTTNIAFNPNFGYFFADKFAGGLRLNISSLKEEDDDAYSTLAVTPFLRYYFLPTAQKVNIFADASYGFGTVGSGDKESFNQFSIMAGPAIFLNPNTALEFGIGYTSQGGDAFGNDLRLNTIGLNIGFQIHLGSGKGSSK